MGTITSSDGTTIAFDRSGRGQPLILVDGALCYRASGPSGPLAELLARHFTVFTYDRRGRGESGDTGPYSVQREIDDIAALIKEAGGSKWPTAAFRSGGSPCTSRRSSSTGAGRGCRRTICPG